MYAIRSYYVREFLDHSTSELKEKGLEYLKDDILDRISLCASGHRFIAGVMEYLLEFESDLV